MEDDQYENDNFEDDNVIIKINVFKFNEFINKFDKIFLRAINLGLKTF